MGFQTNRQRLMMVSVATFPNRLAASLALARLEAAGIRGYLRNEMIHGVLPVGALDVQIWVHATEVASARAILAEVDAVPEGAEEDFREIGTREIRYLQRRQRWMRYRALVWIVILVLIVLLILYGW